MTLQYSCVEWTNSELFTDLLRDKLSIYYFSGRYKRASEQREACHLNLVLIVVWKIPAGHSQTENFLTNATIK